MSASHGGTSHNKSSNALKTIEEIRKGNIRDLYVLTGENDFLKERVVFWLREQTKAEVVRVDAENMDVLAFFDQLFSVFSMRVIVVELPARSHSRCHDKCCFIWELKWRCGGQGDAKILVPK